ncbi:hypothetical protein Q5752_005299 [Cryptotrichosporon argae]
MRRSGHCAAHLPLDGASSSASGKAGGESLSRAMNVYDGPGMPLGLALDGSRVAYAHEAELAGRAPPTSAQIDAVIAAAMANAPPPPPVIDMARELSGRALTPLMTNILPSAIGSDGRVNLFVGNLPYRVRWQDLKDLFRKAGTVLRADVSLGPDNRSRGYGNVLMGSREDAARAIDRFNGYSWQTRTLEVRPDRLPPEYEPQPHMHHKPFFHPPLPIPGHLTPNNMWPPGPSRPPNMLGPIPSLPMPHMPISASPALSNSPGSSYSNLPIPLVGQQTGGVPLGASPLAGSLTAGSGPTPLGWNSARRESLTPFAHVLPEAVTRPRSASPSLVAPIGTSRPTSRDKPPSPTKADALANAHARAPPPGTLGPLPPSMFAGVKAVVEDGRRPSVVDVLGGPSAAGVPALNGLAGQGQALDLGAPATLVDRVVFVQNLPLSLQWQELKDLFRPAGTVLRADIATGPDGRSRGFGTVLLGTEVEASSAVDMLNGRVIDGRTLRVQTERQSLENKHIPLPSDVFKPNMDWQEGHEPPAPASAHTQASNPRLPWSLNTGITTPQRPSSARVNPDAFNDSPHGRHAHPGPINLPPYPVPGDMNPLSPLQTRGLPPMTPSMPGFVFNAYPQTPPVHAQFLSPGGPFSPGAPVTSPIYSNFSPFSGDAAPGAPIGGPAPGPRFPLGRGSAALGTPTTQAFPHNPLVNLAGAPGAPGATDARYSEGPDYFPPVVGLGVDSPTPNRVAGPPSPSPLNGRERMASTSTETDEEEIVKRAAELAIGHGNADGAEPGAAARGDQASANGSAGTPGNGRVSLDAPRTNSGLGVWSAERRASWSDIARGE